MVKAMLLTQLVYQVMTTTPTISTLVIYLTTVAAQVLQDFMTLKQIMTTRMKMLMLI
jgi:hypothetical protein